MIGGGNDLERPIFRAERGGESFFEYAGYLVNRDGHFSYLHSIIIPWLN